jgi:hypothetical protein
LRASAAGGAESSVGHAFISYVREDRAHVDYLQQFLEDAGITVWRDTEAVWPGQDWRAEIRDAITGNALVFLACFSRASVARVQSYQHEEISEAIDRLRQRPHDVTWLIPVRFDDCQIPDRDIGGGRTLRHLHYIDLFGDRYHQNAERLVHAVREILGRTERSEQGPEISIAGPDGADVDLNPPVLSFEPSILQTTDNLAGHVTWECADELNDRVLQGWKPLSVDWRPASGQFADPGMTSEVPPGNTAAIGPLVRPSREWIGGIALAGQESLRGRSGRVGSSIRFPLMQ